MFKHISHSEIKAVKRATLALAEEAVLLTSMAKPLHEMVLMKSPAELFRRKTRTRKTDHLSFLLAQGLGRESHFGKVICQSSPQGVLRQSLPLHSKV